jgi:intracellular sulfur oxidation DsrE/DsrF family protein
MRGLFMIVAMTLPAATAAISAPAGAQSVAIPGYGAIRDMPDAVERPDRSLRYRVVFTLSKGAAKLGETNPSLEKVARFMNLLAHDGVRPAKGDIVAVAFGPATSALVRESKPHGADAPVPNPNIELIRQLQAAGVTVAVCSQALQGNGYAKEQLLPGVRLDDAAIVTIANLQLRGYALIPD